MTVPRKPKPEEAAETARVMRIFDWLVEELDKRTDKRTFDAEGYRIVHAPPPLTGDVLAVAERIAARTETPT